MNCPTCKNKKLSEKIRIGDVIIDRCSFCGGLWFEQDELRLAKDKKIKDARWLDVELKDEKLDWFKFELWKDKIKFKTVKDTKLCPHCQISLNKINYGDSDVEIDICGVCKGVWVEQGEFKKIIKYVKDKADYEVLNNYAKNLISETKEIFTGPESIKSEVADLLVLTKLLKYKLLVQYPTLIKMFLNMPFTK
jgi:Zn-finger nucleic acid-binding protein